MIVFMNLATTTSPYLASGMMSRFSALCRRDICQLALVAMTGLDPAIRRNLLVNPRIVASLRPGKTLRLRSGSLGPLGAVFRAALLAVLDPLGVEHAAQDVVAHAGQILDAAAADHDHRMLLQIVALAGDIADDLEAVGQPNLGDLAQRRIRLLRRRRIDAGAHPAFLRARLKMAGLFAVGLRLPRLADQLANCRHVGPESSRLASRPKAEQKSNFHRPAFARSRRGVARNQ